MKLLRGEGSQLDEPGSQTVERESLVVAVKGSGGCGIDLTRPGEARTRALVAAAEVLGCLLLCQAP